MKPEHIEKLLGGYATDSLTDTEREQLFVAALADQGLFDALATEQPLRDLLDDPVARRRLLRSLERQRGPVFAGISIWRRKSAWLFAASFVAAAVVVVVVSRPAAPPSSRSMPAATAQITSNIQSGIAAGAGPEPKPELKRLEKRQAAVSDEKPMRDTMVARNQRPAAPADVVSETLRQTQPAVALTAAPNSPVASSTAQANMADALQTTVPPKLSARAIFRNSFAPAAIDSRQDLMSMRGSRQTSNQEPAALGGYKQTARGPQQSLEAGLPKAQTGALPAAQLGLRYSVMKRGVNGVYSAVDPAAVFTAGNSVRLNFESNESGYLSVSLRTSDGGSTPLFTKAITAGTNYTIPADGDLRFDEQSAGKKLLVILSRQPESPAESPSPGAELLTEKVKDRETAVYVVDSDARSRVAFEITLSRR